MLPMLVGEIARSEGLVSNEDEVEIVMVMCCPSDTIGVGCLTNTVASSRSDLDFGGHAGRFFDTYLRENSG